MNATRRLTARIRCASSIHQARSRDLRHGKELERLGVEAVEAARGEIGNDVVVEDGRQERASQKLREGDVGLAERRDAVHD